jgi:hypothetical protein
VVLGDRDELGERVTLLAVAECESLPRREQSLDGIDVAIEADRVLPQRGRELGDLGLFLRGRHRGVAHEVGSHADATREQAEGSDAGSEPEAGGGVLLEELELPPDALDDLRGLVSDTQDGVDARVSHQDISPSRLRCAVSRESMAARMSASCDWTERS